MATVEHCYHEHLYVLQRDALCHEVDLVAMRKLKAYIDGLGPRRAMALLDYHESLDYGEWGEQDLYPLTIGLIRDRIAKEQYS